MSACSSDSKILIVGICLFMGKIVHLMVFYCWTIVIRTENSSETGAVSGRFYRNNALCVEIPSPVLQSKTNQSHFIVYNN